MSRATKNPFHNPRLQLAQRILLVVLLLVSLYLVFEFGRIRAGHNIIEAAAARAELRGEINALEKTVRGLREQLQQQETHREIDAAAYAEVEQSLGELQAKIQEQRDAIAFYRGIVSPSEGGPGLRVQDVSLRAGREEREFTLTVVLVQAIRHDRRVSGDVVLEIAGEQDGSERTYSYAELKADEEDADWAFGFRYFQDFDRQLVLPDGFTPLTVNLEVRSRTRSVDSIEASVPWNEARG